MAKDIRTKAHLQGGEIRTKANFGQTVAITVLPDPYEGDTVITPSDERQTLPTRGKTVPVDIAVLPAPTESLATSENGTFVPSSGSVGFSEVVVDVEPSLESLSVTENGLYLPESGTDGFDRVSVDVPPTVPVLQGKAVNPSETAQHVTPDSGYDGLSAVDVGAIPSSYVGAGITRRSGSDLTALGSTVNVPSGYYESSGTKSVQSGQAGTPTASKSAVSNHAISVTPSVSNSEGYISGGTKTGNAVTVSASELVSGTENITANGTYDVVNKASAVVNVPSRAPVLDSLSVTENGTYTPESGVDGFNEVVVDVPTGGSGGLTLIDTVDVNGVNGVRVDIDASWFDDADYVLLLPDLTFSASDWLYIANDATSGGGWAPQDTSANFMFPLFIYRLSSTVYKGAWFRGNSNVQVFNSIASYLYWYLYGSSNTMTGTIKIYGIKVTE